MNNSAILYLYDAKLCNPNGDPDEENRPRMDYEREINLVSDLRLKRYIRDYLLQKGYELYVQKVDNASVTSEQRISSIDDKGDIAKAAKEAFIDIRLFGATITKKNDNHSITGAVQFNWGYSLNPVKLLESSITSHFSTDAKNLQGTIGKDYRVQYSLIAFSGIVSGKRAEETGLKKEDLDLMDEAMVKAIPLLATRSKIGQEPRLYMRFELKDSETVLKDLRNYIEIRKGEEIDDIRDIRSISEYSLEIGALADYINSQASKIKNVLYFYDNDLNITIGGERKSVEGIFSGLPLTLPLTRL
ncbi:MAG: type I-B CRISPR-associated protein Cas7/Csh2 [Clostridiaceae bacterium]|nr:type I-B CRISPR-associated protein Cas7/Csh2 [Clostridiaceae bacterium]